MDERGSPFRVERRRRHAIERCRSDSLVHLHRNLGQVARQPRRQHGKSSGQGGRRPSQRSGLVGPAERCNPHAHRHDQRLERRPAYVDDRGVIRPRGGGCLRCTATDDRVALAGHGPEPEIQRRLDQGKYHSSVEWQRRQERARPTGHCPGNLYGGRDRHAAFPRNGDQLGRLSRPGRWHRSCAGGRRRARRGGHLLADHQVSGGAVHGHRAGRCKPHAEDYRDRPKKPCLERSQNRRRRVRRHDARKTVRGIRWVDRHVPRRAGRYTALGEQPQQSLERRQGGHLQSNGARPSPSGSPGPQ